jgi:hypothetical protein
MADKFVLYHISDVFSNVCGLDGYALTVAWLFAVLNFYMDLFSALLRS